MHLDLGEGRTEEEEEFLENGVWLQRQRGREGSRMREAAEMRGVAFRLEFFPFIFRVRG